MTNSLSETSGNRSRFAGRDVSSVSRRDQASAPAWSTLASTFASCCCGVHVARVSLILEMKNCSGD
ncbi:MAG: hypothetical protein ACRYF5_07480, partial [Janthinobacterium lividum]